LKPLPGKGSNPPLRKERAGAVCRRHGEAQKIIYPCNIPLQSLVRPLKQTTMGKNNMPGLFAILAACCMFFFLAGCRKESATRTYTLYTPIYKSKTEVLAAINGNASQSVETAGKFYIKDNFIYLNEVDKGIHIIDNSDPSHPAQVAFLNIPGNQDIAVKGNILYADMYGDLLALDISNPRKATITASLNNFFTQRMYTNGVYASDSTKVVVDWIEKDTTVPVENNIYPPGCANCGIFFNAAASSSGGSKSNGKAGSMAKMVLMHDYLYAITEPHSLGIVSTTDPRTPSFVSTTYAGYDLETIYPFEDKLFMGSAVGLFMYDMSDPLNPVKLGQFSHGRACDPVVTDGDYAYVTLHAGTECGGDANELNIINVKDLMNPTLVKTYPLTKPTGLSKDGDLLFICDGGSGVRIYNTANPSGLKLLQQISSNEPYDVIAGNKHALVVAKDGLYQYDYSDINHIRQLSFFSLNH